MLFNVVDCKALLDSPASEWLFWVRTWFGAACEEEDMKCWFECCDKRTVIWSRVRGEEKKSNTNLAFKMFGE